METYPLSNRQGHLLGRYRLEQLVGSGGISEVWLATDTQLLRQVALKILPTTLANDEQYLQDFMREARAAASLEHPHILSIHDFGEQNFASGEIVPYLVMPYVPGGTLGERMRKAGGPLPVQEALRYLRQAALAIDHAHSKRILHRDVKPANMLLRDDWLLLTDFGIARLLGTNTARGKTYANLDAPEYMAPEQIMGRAEPASDRYALAVVAYQLFTGIQPFHGSTPNATMSQQMAGSLPRPRQLNPEIPLQVEHLLVRALAREPEQRPPSCIVLVDALQHAWLDNPPHQSDPEATLIAPRSKPIRNISLTDITNEEATAFKWPESGGEMATPLSLVSPGPSRPADPGGTPPHLPIPSLPSQPITDHAAAAVEGAATWYMGGPTAQQADPSGQAAPVIPPPTRKVRRRAVLAGSGVAAAMTIGGGILAYETLLKPNAHPPQPKSIVTPTALPGPHKLTAGLPLLALTAHKRQVWAARWDASGRYLMTVGVDGYIMLWDIADALQHNPAGSRLVTPLNKRTVANLSFQGWDLVCWSPDSRQFIVGGTNDATVYVIDAFNANSQSTVYNDIDASVFGGTYKMTYQAVVPGPQRDQFTVVNYAFTSNNIPSSQAQVWRLGQTDVPVITYDTLIPHTIGALNWSRDGRTLAAISYDYTSQNVLLLWNSADHAHPKSQKLLMRDKKLTTSIIYDTVSWSPVAPHLLLLSNADVALIWDVRTNARSLVLGAATMSAKTPLVGKLAWSPNGRYVATSYGPTNTGTASVFAQPNPPLQIWDVGTLLIYNDPTTIQQPMLTFSSPSKSLQHTQTILDIDWSPDGRYLATSSFDGTVLIWQVDGA